MGHPDEQPAGNGRIGNAERISRLAGRDHCERRRRRHHRPAQGGVRGAIALTRQPLAEPGADGRRPSRPRPGDALPRPHRSDRAGPDLRGCGRGVPAHAALATSAHRQIRASVAVGSARSCASTTRFSTAPDGHLRDQVAAHIGGGAARLTKARVSITQRAAKAGRRPALQASAGCARYAPGQDTCGNVSAGQCDIAKRPPEP